MVDMLEMTHKLDPEYKISISGGHRAEEAVEMLKHFYDGENPNAPNPKVKGVRIKKTTEKEAKKLVKLKKILLVVLKLMREWTSLQGQSPTSH